MAKVLLLVNMPEFDTPDEVRQFVRGCLRAEVLVQAGRLKDWADVAVLNPHAHAMVTEVTDLAAQAAEAVRLLGEFCRDVDAVTLERNEDGYASPRGTDGWSDLGHDYFKACELLGREPVWDEDEPHKGGWAPPAAWFDDAEDDADDD